MAAPIRQDQVDDAISEIVETIGGPTDIEVSHPDGTLESHRLTAHTSPNTAAGGPPRAHLASSAGLPQKRGRLAAPGSTGDR
ncbi:hypothetical protein GCM10011359_18910 [Nesterenkonia alkaliphila]|nr:hypothetical protein GCM10011359_18910 [Nesterenkonia alkaliphila]